MKAFLIDLVDPSDETKSVLTVAESALDAVQRMQERYPAHELVRLVDAGADTGFEVAV